MTTDLEDALAALAWLVEAGADEAVGDAPLNRLQTKAAAHTSHPPREGGSKSTKQISGRGDASALVTPPRKIFAQPRSDFSTLPQGEGVKKAGRSAAVSPTSVLNSHAHDNDHIGRAMEIARA